MKKTIRNLLRKIGYDIIKFRNFTPSKFDDLYKKIIEERQDQISIFDVGSHRGESINRFNSIFSNPKIHAFEPDIENFAVLTKKYSENRLINLNNCGVGNSQGTLKFHKYKKSDIGGFNKIDANNIWTKIRSEQSDTTPEDFFISSNEVKITTLDSYIEEHSIDKINLLKIDTQGFEDKVLMGATKSLEKNIIDYIQLELIITGPYERSLSFKDLEELLHPYGYKLYGIQDGSNYFDMPILQFDLLFARKDCYLAGNYQ